jgi:hypothetical protein
MHTKWVSGLSGVLRKRHLRGAKGANCSDGTNRRCDPRRSLYRGHNTVGECKVKVCFFWARSSSDLFARGIAFRGAAARRVALAETAVPIPTVDDRFDANFLVVLDEL